MLSYYVGPRVAAIHFHGRRLTGMARPNFRRSMLGTQPRVGLISVLILLAIFSAPSFSSVGLCGPPSFAKTNEMFERLSKDPNASRDQWIKVIHSFKEIYASGKERRVANQSLFLAGRASLRLYHRGGKTEDLDRAIQYLYRYTRIARSGHCRLEGLKELKEAHLLKRRTDKVLETTSVPTLRPKTGAEPTPQTSSPANHRLPPIPEPRDPGPPQWAAAAKASPAIPRYGCTGNPFCSGELAAPTAKDQLGRADSAPAPSELLEAHQPRAIEKNASCPPKFRSPGVSNDPAPAPKIASLNPAPTDSALPVVRRIEPTPKTFVIVIDPGHGGKDPGAVSENGRIKEKDLTLAIATRLEKMLLSRVAGIKVEMTRTDDRFLTLQERTALANSFNADLFISLHCNADSDSRSRGVETFYLSKASSPRAMRMAARENGIPLATMSDLQATLLDLMLTSKKSESDKLAKTVHSNLVKNLAKAAPRIRDRGIKQAPFYVLLGAKMPAILVECAFISNGREEKQLTSDRFLDSVAQGIATGAATYLRELGDKS